MANSTTQEQFKDWLLTYGTDLSRWPVEAFTKALTLLESSPEARALLAEYQPVDDLMNAGKSDTPSADLLDRIMGAIEKKQ